MFDAVIVCDMWDQHWSPAAVVRQVELAPRVAEFLDVARAAGVIVIHSPGECMEYYREHPGRLLAQETARQVDSTAAMRTLAEEAKLENLPEGMKSSLHSLPGEPKLEPVNGSRGDTGQDIKDWRRWLTDRGHKMPFPWTHQTDLVPILEGDYVTDIGQEVWRILEGLDRVAVVGVHTDLCVVGRPYGLRRLVSLGKQVTLIGDLTDTLQADMEPTLRHIAAHICEVKNTSETFRNRC